MHTSSAAFKTPLLWLTLLKLLLVGRTRWKYQWEKCEKKHKCDLKRRAPQFVRKKFSQFLPCNCQFTVWILPNSLSLECHVLCVYNLELFYRSVAKLNGVSIQLDIKHYDYDEIICNFSSSDDSTVKDINIKCKLLENDILIFWCVC